jgi:hypothetical protein
MVRLERLGIATAAVATEPFLDEALEQARLLGMPDYRMVYIPHPVQLLTLDELHARADAVFEQIVARLVAGATPGRGVAGPTSGCRPGR